MIDLHTKDTQRYNRDEICIHNKEEEAKLLDIRKKLSVVGRCTANTAAISGSLFPWTSLLLFLSIVIGSTI